MHEWHTQSGNNVFALMKSFTGYEYRTDYADETQHISSVTLLNRFFATKEEAINHVTNYSYGGNTAFIAMVCPKKKSKAFEKAYTSFCEKNRDYQKFNMELTISYGRKANKVTCPHCNSSINLTYGDRYKHCPVCGSDKIISDSNWNMLATKKRLVQKASDNLAIEASKCDITFVCGFEWHC